MDGNYPSDEDVKTLCRIGQGDRCCRYLTMAPSGWSCEHLSSLRLTLDSRAEAGLMKATSVNCSGKDSRS